MIAFLAFTSLPGMELEAFPALSHLILTLTLPGMYPKSTLLPEALRKKRRVRPVGERIEVPLVLSAKIVCSLLFYSCLIPRNLRVSPRNFLLFFFPAFWGTSTFCIILPSFKIGSLPIIFNGKAPKCKVYPFLLSVFPSRKSHSPPIWLVLQSVCVCVCVCVHLLCVF